MRSSLVMQKLAAKAAKFDFVAPSMDLRTSTVVKNALQASRQNLMVIQGEGNSSVIDNPIVNPPEYDAITQAFIMNQLQG